MQQSFASGEDFHTQNAPETVAESLGEPELNSPGEEKKTNELVEAARQSRKFVQCDSTKSLISKS